MKRTAWLLVLGVLVVGPGWVTAEDSYTIKVKKSAKGDVGLVGKEQAVENNTVISKDGKLLDQSSGTTREVVRYKEEIVEADGDKPPTRVRRTYEKAQTIARDGKSTNLPFHGKTILIEKKGGKTTFKIEGGEELSAKDVPGLVKEFQQEDETHDLPDLFLPPSPVKVGETWKLDKKLLQKLFGPDKGIKADLDKATATGKLVKAYKKQGKQFGVLQYDIDIPIESALGLKMAAGTRSSISLTAEGCIDGSADIGTTRTRQVLKGDGSTAEGFSFKVDIVDTSVETREEVAK